MDVIWLYGALILFLLMFLGVPVVFVTTGFGIIWLIITGKIFLLGEIVSSFSNGLDNFILLAIPLFVVAGEIMNSGGITEDIFNLSKAFVGWLKGGLAYVNIIASTIFGGISGASASDIAGLGLIEMETMKKTGYDIPFSAALTAATSIQAPLIPPSMPAVVVGGLLGISIGGLFLGGLVPGLLIAGGCAVVVKIRIKQRNYEPHPIPFSGAFALKACKKGIPAIIAPIIIVGGIIFGVFSPTEAATIAAFYSLIIGFWRKNLKLNMLPEIMLRATEKAGKIFVVLGGAAVFQWVISYEGFVTLFNSWYVSLVGNSVFLFFLMLNIIFIFWGMWLPIIVAQLLLCPIFYPIALSLGVNPIHFGIVSIFNLMIGLLTPPVGSNIFITQSIANVGYVELVKELIPFLIIDFVLLVLITYFPGIVLFIPRIFGFA